MKKAVKGGSEGKKKPPSKKKREDSLKRNYKLLPKKDREKKFKGKRVEAQLKGKVGRAKGKPMKPKTIVRRRYK